MSKPTDQPVPSLSRPQRPPVGPLLAVAMSAIVGLTALEGAVAAGTAPDIMPAPPPYRAPRLDARVVWDSHLPAGQVAQFTSFHLLDGLIYAIGTDGVVMTVRADTGEVSWIRRLVPEGDRLWPPLAYHAKDVNAVVFTLLHDVVLLDPKNGVEVNRLDVAKSCAAPVAVAPGHVFVMHPGGHLASYRLRDDYIHWRVSFDGYVSLAPLYVPALNIVVAADEVGLVAGIKNVDRADHRVLFKHHLQSRPSGPLAQDGHMLYLSTENQLLHAIDMGETGPEDKPGEIVWQYRLAGIPQGGPTLTGTAVYQSTYGGGLQRIAKQPGEFRGWFDPAAREFLAEWSNGVVVLRGDGQIALIGRDPAAPLAVADAGGFDGGIPNPWNDAVFLTTRLGTIRCIRPAGAAPLQLASFMPAAAPAPVEFEDRETAIDKLRREAAERRAKREQTPTVVEVTVPTPSPAVRAAEEAPAPRPAPRDPLRSNIPVVE